MGTPKKNNSVSMKKQVTNVNIYIRDTERLSISNYEEHRDLAASIRSFFKLAPRPKIRTKALFKDTFRLAHVGTVFMTV